MKLSDRQTIFSFIFLISLMLFLFSFRSSSPHCEIVRRRSQSTSSSSDQEDYQQSQTTKTSPIIHNPATVEIHSPKEENLGESKKSDSFRFRPNLTRIDYSSSDDDDSKYRCYHPEDQTVTSALVYDITEPIQICGSQDMDRSLEHSDSSSQVCQITLTYSRKE